VYLRTLTKLLGDIGEVCAAYQDKAFCNLPDKRIQCDEIWSFAYAKQKNVPEDLRYVFGVGDVYAWVVTETLPALTPALPQRRQ
jgi:hypothetical protein